MEDPTKPGANNSVWKVAALVTALGTNFAMCTIGGFYFGSWLDKLWLTNGVGIGLGVLAGIAVGIVSIAVLIRSVVRGK
ncbi:AtpZ/AtpI family protein [Paenibacillus macerans]|uniref:AtpZ/AtpI family protein n=1 Tax=Paenibacillus macerans TaxID=44252 RepID=UPI0020415985|nr:AtpZ/AtpI family protein [Paenibacillus macerans]MCM3700987.1 AtpZ/AtpI family protein [Paenibacillus macerans]